MIARFRLPSELTPSPFAVYESGDEQPVVSSDGALGLEYTNALLQELSDRPHPYIEEHVLLLDERICSGAFAASDAWEISVFLLDYVVAHARGATWVLAADVRGCVQMGERMLDPLRAVEAAVADRQPIAHRFVTEVLSWPDAGGGLESSG